MAYNPLSITTLAKGVVPFTDATPTRVIWVSPNGSDKNSGSASAPFKTIQAAVDTAKPGTAIMVKSGTYTENVSLDDRSGTASKPIWLVSADGPGAAKVVAKSASKAVFYAFGEDNLVIKGFQIVGGTEGIKLTQGGHSLTDMTTNVVIQDNIIRGQSIDGIKTSQSVNFVIAGNTIHDIKSQEGIDNVYMRNSIIANNEVYNVRGLSGIVAKGGSQNVKIIDNYVHHVPDGILVGGFTTEQGKTFPKGINYEAKGFLVQGNVVTDVTKHAVNAYGAVDSKIVGNLLKTTSSKHTVVNVGTDNNGYVSKNVQFVDNIVNKSGWLKATSGSVSVTSGNKTSGSFDGSDVGPSGLKSASPAGSSTKIIDPGPKPVDASSKIALTKVKGDWKETGPTTKTIEGGSRDDHLKGTSGNDKIDGKAGWDRMEGGKGNDLYIVGSTRDVVVEKAGEGIDTIHLWDRSYKLPVHVENLVIFTKAGARVTDNGQDNILTGGAGKDTFVFTRNHGHDLVKNFQVGQDKIEFDPSVKMADISVAKNAGGDMVLLHHGHSVTLDGVDPTTSLSALF